MNKPISVELLEKYVDGKCTAEEVAVVENWYKSFEREHDYISGLPANEQARLEGQIYDHIMQNIGVSENVVRELPITKSRYPSLRLWYAVAGIAAVFLLVIAVIYNNQVNLKSLPAASTASAELVGVTNKTRQIYKISLPDKSTVWLSPGAGLVYPKTFGAKFRTVSMSGVCFFEVTKNHAKPFIIKSRSIVTKVWGTSFLVRDDLPGNLADVTVVTGKVSVSINENCNHEKDVLKLGRGEVMLYPHQKVTYLAEQHLLKAETTVDEPAIRIWNRLNLAFENQALREIVPVLNAKFHVHIKVSNEKLNHYVLNGDFAGFNLPDVLEALKKSLNVDYEIKTNTIELK